MRVKKSAMSCIKTGEEKAQYALDLREGQCGVRKGRLRDCDATCTFALLRHARLQARLSSAVRDRVAEELQLPVFAIWQHAAQRENPASSEQEVR